MVAHCADGSPSNTCCSSKKVYLLSKVKKADALQLAYAADKVVVAFGLVVLSSCVVLYLTGEIPREKFERSNHDART
jgi:hypothetical protein